MGGAGGIGAIVGHGANRQVVAAGFHDGAQNVFDESRGLVRDDVGAVLGAAGLGRHFDLVQVFRGK